MMEWKNAVTRIEAQCGSPRHMAEESWSQFSVSQIVHSLMVTLSDHVHIWTSAFQLQELTGLPFTEKQKK